MPGIHFRKSGKALGTMTVASLSCYRRSLVFGSNGLHYRSLFRIGIATVVFVGQPAAVRIGLDVEPTAGKSESQRRITALLYQPAVLLPCLINRVSLFIFHRISQLIQLCHLFISGILLEDSSLIQLYEIYTFSKMLFGKGLGRWNTIPTFLRSSSTCTPFLYMS